MQMNEEKLRADEQELINILRENPTLDGVEDIVCVCQAPGYDYYRTWLFEYGKNELLVILNDDGNGYYSYVGSLHEMIDNHKYAEYKKPCEPVHEEKFINVADRF